MNYLVSSRPKSILSSMFFDDFDKFFNDVFADVTRTDLSRNVEGYPVANIFSNENGDVKFEIAVTGFNKNELQVFVEDGCLIVKGDKEEKQEDGGNWKLIAGKLKRVNFEKRYKLSNRLAADKTDVEITDNGLLVIQIPAREEVKPKELTIRQAKQLT